MSIANNSQDISRAACLPDERSVKRHRTEATPAIEFVRDTDVWMADGNVVLGVADSDEDKEGVVHVFKCHMSILTKQSPVFASLFALPQPADSAEAAERYDGVPLVMLHDPYPALKGLLKMLYDPR